MKIRFIFNDAETPDENRDRLLDLLSIANYDEEFLEKIENIILLYDKNRNIYKHMKALKISSSDAYLKQLNRYKKVINHIIDSINKDDDSESTIEMSDKDFVNSKYVQTIKSKLDTITLKASEQLKDPDTKKRIDTKIANSKFEAIIKLISEIKKLDNMNYKEFNKKYNLGDKLKDTQQFIRAEISKFGSYSKTYENGSEIEKTLYYKYLESLKEEHDNFIQRVKVTGSAKNVKAIIDRILSFNNMEQPSEIDNLVEMMKKYGDSNVNADNVHESALKYIIKLLSKIPEEVLEDSSMYTTMLHLEKIKNGFEKTIKTKDRNKEISKEVANAVSSGIDSASKLVGSGIKAAKNTASKVLTGKVGIDK